MEKIIVQIKKDGTTTVEVNGVKGQACKDLTRGMEEALGKVENVQETQEIYESDSIQNVHQS